MIRKLLLLLPFIFFTGSYIQAEGGKMNLIISSMGFRDGGSIPLVYTCDGRNISPSLSWKGQLKDIKSFTLIVEDPDAPGGIFTHWVLYDLPGDVTELSEAIPLIPHLKNGASQGRNDFGKIGYSGPCPPRGHGRHRYLFLLRALDVKSVGLAPGAGRRDVERRMRGHIIGEGRLTGLYERRW